MATVSRVLCRPSSRSTAVATTGDFLVGPSRLVGLSELYTLEPERVSPYAFDVDRGLVTFVRTWPDVDLATAHPFFYAAQRQHACDVVQASVEEVHAVAATTRTPKADVAFLYSAGRSGSTAVGKLASRLPSVQTLSEPDVFAQVALQRHPGDIVRDVELVRLTQSLTKLLVAHRAAREPSLRTLLVKQRGMGVFGAGLVHLALPDARALHLVRDTADVVDSYVSTFLRHPLLALGRRLGLDRLAVRIVRAAVGFTHPWIPRTMPGVVQGADGSHDGAVEVLALAIRAMHDELRRLTAEGAIELAATLRYERLTSSPRAFARELAAGLGVAAGPELERALRSAADVTSTDAQLGSSVVSRGVRSLDAADVARVHAAVGGREESLATGRAA